jgi:hypothetical protein
VAETCSEVAKAIFYLNFTKQVTNEFQIERKEKEKYGNRNVTT